MFRRHLTAALAFGVIALSLVGCSKSSTSTMAPVDLSPPQAPTNLHAFIDPSINRDWLMWDASGSAGVVSYEIYSAPTSSATGTLIATVNASETNFMLDITNVSSVEYYRVRAIGGNAVPSAFTSALGIDRSAWDGGHQPTGGPGRTMDGNF